MHHIGPNLFNRYSRKLTKIFVFLFVLSILCSGYLVYKSPIDYLQGEYVKIMYVHVPSAWFSMLFYTSIASLGVLYLVFRNPFYFTISKAITPVGASFALITLITGAIWGHPTWGTWWVWDARLTSMLILFFIYMGCIALQESFEDEQRAAVASSAFSILGLINIPIIKFSVNLWSTLHQPASVFKLGGPSIHSDMLIPLFAVTIALLWWSLYIITLRIETLIHISKYKRQHFIKQNEELADI